MVIELDELYLSILHKYPNLSLNLKYIRILKVWP